MLVKLHCRHFLFCVCETVWQRIIYGIMRPHFPKPKFSGIGEYWSSYIKTWWHLLLWVFFTSFKEKSSKIKPCLYALLNSKAWNIKRWKFWYFFGWMHSDNWEVNWSLSSCHPCLFWFLELGLLHEICFHSRMSDYLFFCLAGTVLHVIWYKGIPGLSSCSYLGNLAWISFENSVYIKS